MQQLTLNGYMEIYKMDEEISLEERYSKAKCSLLDELIEKYFVGIEERIRSATNREEAKLLADNACRGFERQCESEIIPLFFKRYVNGLFEKYWEKQP